MADGLAGGLNQEGTFTPIQLWAGEPNGQSSQGVAAKGYDFGQKNVRGETFKFPVVTMVDGKFIPWGNGDGDTPPEAATGSITFANAVPVNGDSISINGIEITFVTDNPGAHEIAIAGGINAQATALAEFLVANSVEFGVTGVASNATVNLTAVDAGADGNLIALAKDYTTPADLTLSGNTLTGGTDIVAELPVGVLPHALDTTVTGYDRDVDTPYFLQGHFNFDALDLPQGVTYAQARRAFARTPINVQKLY